MAIRSGRRKWNDNWIDSHPSYLVVPGNSGSGVRRIRGWELVRDERIPGHADPGMVIGFAGIRNFGNRFAEYCFSDPFNARQTVG